MNKTRSLLGAALLLLSSVTLPAAQDAILNKRGKQTVVAPARTKQTAPPALSKVRPIKRTPLASKVRPIKKGKSTVIR